MGLGLGLLFGEKIPWSSVEKIPLEKRIGQKVLERHPARGCHREKTHFKTFRGQASVS